MALYPRFKSLQKTRSPSPSRLKKAPRRSFQILNRFQRRLLPILAVFFFILLWTRWLSEDDDYDMTWLDSDPDGSSRGMRGFGQNGGIYEAGQKSTESEPLPMTKMNNGLLWVGSWKGKHPLLELIDSAQQSWQERLAARPKTVMDAFRSYKSKYSRSPPITFHHFFTLAGDNLPATCLLPHSDTLRLYDPLLPSTIQKRQRGIEGSPGTVTIIIKNGRVGRGFVTGQADDTLLRDSAQAFVDIISEDAENLPNMRFTLSPVGPRNPIPHRLREDMDDLRNIGESFSESEGDWDEDGDGDGIYSFRGWSDACRRDSPAFRKHRNEKEDNSVKFIHSNKPLSPCYHRPILSVSPLFASLPPKVGILSPVFGYTRTAIHGDAILPRPLTAEDDHADIHRKTSPWNQKKAALYWRGLAGFSDQHDELVHPSNRLMNLLQSPYASSISEIPIMIPDGEGFKMEYEKDAREVLQGMVDLAFEGCEEDHDCFGFEDRYRFVEPSQYSQWSAHKYVIDLDDEDGPSSQFRELLLSGSLVFRASVFEDYWTNHALPWVHYVPIQPDFSDLASTLLFFRAHDDIAKRIAEAGQALARDCFGRAGVKAGIFGVLMEFGRMWNLERKNLDMTIWNEEDEAWE